MVDRNKVIKGLEWCMNEKHDCYREKGCPYENEGDDVGCKYALHRDALAMLKAQEPRVMTLEEVNALDWDYCYLEQERLPGKEYRGMLGKYIMTCVTWPSITAAKISYGAENYGRTWRCWTSRPTKEQMEAVKWE